MLAGSVWYVWYGMYGTHVYGLFDTWEFKICCKIFIAAEHGRYGSMKDCGVSIA